MKKINWKISLIMILLLTVFLSACSNQSDKEIQSLQNDISNIVDRMDSGILTSEEAFTLSYQLQLRNKDFINKDLQKDFDKLDHLVQEKMKVEKEKKESEKLAQLSKQLLPDRAQKLWILIPTNMLLDQGKSKQTTVSASWYNSIVLVYKWAYEVAMQEAAKIAQNASLPVSSDFASLQERLGSVIKWIVYTNHWLLDTNIEYLISITVDEDWSLTIEVTNYKQMNAK